MRKRKTQLLEKSSRQSRCFLVGRADAVEDNGVALTCKFHGSVHSFAIKPSPQRHCEQLTMSRRQGSDWNNHQTSNFEGLLAMSRCQVFDSNSHQKPNFEGLLPMSRCQGCDWNSHHKYPKVKPWRPADHVTLSRLWLKLSPQVSKSQTLKACWPCHVVKAVIETLTKSIQKSNFEGLLTMSHCPWNPVRLSTSN